MIDSNMTYIVFCNEKHKIVAPFTGISYKCNPVLSQLTLEVIGTKTVDIAIQGCVTALDEEYEDLKDDECTWTNLACIKADTLEMSSKVTANGIYYISTPGINRIRFVCKSLSGDNPIITGIGVR